MVIDTSAVIAILWEEPLARRLASAINASGVRLISAVSLVEAALVMEGRQGEEAGRDLDLFRFRTKLELVPVDEYQAEQARIAWRRFGKGRHKAGLNLGDCFSYALAKTRRLPLLFCGDDFPHTDIEPALR